MRAEIGEVLVFQSFEGFVRNYGVRLALSSYTP